MEGFKKFKSIGSPICLLFCSGYHVVCSSSYHSIGLSIVLPRLFYILSHVLFFFKNVFLFFIIVCLFIACLANHSSALLSAYGSVLSVSCSVCLLTILSVSWLFIYPSIILPVSPALCPSVS